MSRLLDDSPDQNTSLRSPVSLVIKTLTIHAFALVNYAYVSNLLRRPTRSHIQALRLLFFLFVPTLPLIEVAISIIKAVIQFLTDYKDDDNEDEIQVRYYLSGAVGMHAQLSQDDDDKSTKDSRRNLHLLSIGPHAAEKHKVPIDWVWAGKLCASLFALLQAVGTIVMWARRLNTWQADTLAFDHRNGAMGIASTICSCICVILLALRLNWKVSKSFEVARIQSGGTFLRNLGIAQGETSVLICECLMSMLLHLLIATAANRDNKWLYTSVGGVAFLFTSRSSVFLLQGWQTIFPLIFLYVFRHDLLRRLGLENEKYAEYFRHKSLKRLKALLGLALVLWLITDIIWLFVADVIKLVRESKNCRQGCRQDYIGVWWQDPLSDELVVI